MDNESDLQPNFDENFDEYFGDPNEGNVNDVSSGFVSSASSPSRKRKKTAPTITRARKVNPQNKEWVQL